MRKLYWGKKISLETKIFSDKRNNLCKQHFPRTKIFSFLTLEKVRGWKRVLYKGNFLVILLIRLLHSLLFLKLKKSQKVFLFLLKKYENINLPPHSFLISFLFTYGDRSTKQQDISIMFINWFMFMLEMLNIYRQSIISTYAIQHLVFLSISSTLSCKVFWILTHRIILVVFDKYLFSITLVAVTVWAYWFCYYFM